MNVLRIGRYRVMYDITAETVSVWHLGRGWAGSYRLPFAAIHEDVGCTYIRP